MLNGEKLIDAAEALNLILRPDVFVWAPDIIMPGQKVQCPECLAPASRQQWWRPRVLHSATHYSMYIAMKYHKPETNSRPGMGVGATGLQERAARLTVV